MNKKISSPIAITIIVAGVVFVGLAINWQFSLFPAGYNSIFVPAWQLSKEKACLNSGGKVVTSLCCQATGDFPNLCLIGACGCAPNYSHQVKTCDCGEEKCFNGKKCITLEGE